MNRDGFLYSFLLNAEKYITKGIFIAANTIATWVA